MAIVLGTNAGFVASAPGADPSGDSTITMDTNTWACKDTSPVDIVKITEVGWWCDNATEEANFEVGLYAHDAGSDVPSNLLFSDTINAKGTDSGWKSKAVDWSVDPSTVYWIAVQLDDTTTTTNIDYHHGTGRMSYDNNTTALPASFVPSASYDYPVAIYAVYSTEAGEVTAFMSPNSKFWG